MGGEGCFSGHRTSQPAAAGIEYGWGYRVGVLGVVDYPGREGGKGRQMGPIDWEFWAASPETWAPSVTPKDEELFGQVVRRQTSISFSICDMEVASPLISLMERV